MEWSKKKYYSLNAKILNLERRYGKESQIVQRVYRTIGRAYGVESKSRFSDINTLTGKDREKVYKAFEAVSQSEYMSAEGRARIRERAKRAFAQYHAKYKDNERLEQVFDYFKNSQNWGRIRELAGEEKSDIVLDEIMDIESEYGREAAEAMTNAWLNQLGKENEESDIMRYMSRLEGEYMNYSEDEGNEAKTMLDWLKDYGDEL